MKIQEGTTLARADKTVGPAAIIDKIIRNNSIVVKKSEKYIYGLADLKGLLHGRYAGYTHGISLARKLEDNIINEISKGPTLAYFNLYNNVNRELDQLADEVAGKLNSTGIESLPLKPTAGDSELDNDFLRSLHSHKMTATRAGLGWIGKSDLLISLKFGPRIRLTTILFRTEENIRTKAVEKSLCGKCDVCVKACPGGAVSGKLWDIDTDRDEYFDPFKCRNFCKKISGERIRKNISICGICVSVCPRGKRGTIL